MASRYAMRDSDQLEYTAPTGFDFPLRALINFVTSLLLKICLRVQYHVTVGTIGLKFFKMSFIDIGSSFTLVELKE